VSAVRRGYTGAEPGERVWTFSSSLLFSLSVFTTIGYGALVPRTTLGKVATMVYALLGIPLLCIYLANIGSILTTAFKFLYSKLCRCETKPADLPKQATLPSIRESDSGSGAEEGPVPVLSLQRSASCRRGSVCVVPPLVRQEELEEDRPVSLLQRMTSMPGSTKISREETQPDVVKFKLVEDLSLVTVPVTTCLLVLISYVILGAAFFSAWEGWTGLDGVYFCFTSLLTIGFGDFVPGNSYVYNVSGAVSEREAAAKLVLACCYLLLGLAILCMCFNLIQEKISTQVRSMCRALGCIKQPGEEEDI